MKDIFPYLGRKGIETDEHKASSRPNTPDKHIISQGKFSGRTSLIVSPGTLVLQSLKGDTRVPTRCDWSIRDV